MKKKKLTTLQTVGRWLKNNFKKGEVLSIKSSKVALVICKEPIFTYKSVKDKQQIYEE